MNGIAKALSIVTMNFNLPGWVILAGAVMGAIFVFLLLVRWEPHDNPLTLLVLIGMFVGGMGVGTALVREVQRAHAFTEVSSLEQRAAAIDAAAADAGLGCINADEPLQAACEVVLFEDPQNVAAARGLVRARLALVEDTFAYARQRGAAQPLERLAVWRRPLERDPYGITASVLLDQRGCSKTSCPQLAVLGDVDQVTANMAEDRYGTLVAKYAPIWERVARNRGAIAQPVRTGPFGFPIVERPSAAPAAGETPPPANLPLENGAAPGVTQPSAGGAAPLPPARPPAGATIPAQPRPTRPAPPRAPQPPAPAPEPAPAQ